MYRDFDSNNIKNSSSDNINYSYTKDYTRMKSEDVSILSWIGILIALAIPFINLIAIFIIAFAPENETLKNFGKASLILGGISILLLLIAM